MAGVIVVGSSNVDQVFRVDRIPEPGETVLSTGFANARGGKGQNQAVAAVRAGAPTVFVTAVGDDGFGRLTTDGLTEDGIDLSRVRTVTSPTGTALIAVDPHGENTIIVEAGANRELTPLDDGDRAAIAEASVLVLQLEIPLETVTEAAVAGRAAGTTVILNAAPIAELPDALLTNLDVLIVNEHEAAHLRASTGADDLTSLVDTVIVTLGADGAALQRRGQDEVRVPAPKVAAVDATGAGDTFCGALGAVLAEGVLVEDALRFAVTAASLSVQNHGAVPSIPLRAAIDAAVAG
jgi:ribokinase